MIDDDDDDEIFFFLLASFLFPLLLLLFSCPYRDDRYLTTLKTATNVQFPSHYQRFVFKMFTFVDQGNLSPLREKVMHPTVWFSCSPHVTSRPI